MLEYSQIVLKESLRYAEHILNHAKYILNYAKNILNHAKNILKYGTLFFICWKYSYIYRYNPIKNHCFLLCLKAGSH